MSRLGPDLEYVDALLLAQPPEILERHAVYVGRVVPFERQLLRHRQPPLQGKRQPYAVRREVRERHYGLVGYAQSLVQKPARILDLLQRVRHDRDVVVPVWNDRKPLVDVLPDYVVAVCDGLLVALDVDLDAVALDASPGAQHVEQRAVAAADVYDARTLLHHRQGLGVQTLLPLHHLDVAPRQETADDPGEMLDVGQERVMAGAALEVAVADRLACGLERTGDLLRLPCGKEYVVLVRDDKRARLDARERRVERTVAEARVGEVHRPRDVQVAVGVEPAQELRRLVVEIAFDLEIGLEEPVALGALRGRRVYEVLLEPPVELVLQQLAREIGDVRQLPRARKAGLRPLAVALQIVVAAVPLRVVGYGRAAHDAERYGLRVEVGAGRDEARLLHFVWIARHPVDDLQPAVAAADERREPLDAKLPQQHAEDVHRVVEGVLRKARAVRPSGVRVDRHRPRRAAAAAEDVRADHVVAVRVDRATGADHALPPATRTVLAGSYASDVGVAGQGVADVDRVVSVKRRAALLVRHLYLLQNAAIG